MSVIHLFDDKNCCKFNSTDIPIGKSVQIPDINNDQSGLGEDLLCSEKLVLCQAAEYNQKKPNMIIHNLENSRCCNYNGKSLRVGDSFLDAEVQIL